MGRLPVRHGFQAAKRASCITAANASSGALMAEDGEKTHNNSKSSAA